MRKQNSLKNILTNILPYIVLTILGFLRLRVLLDKLGLEIYALNQLFIQIFAYISLAEAGLGVLITQLYYKCFANNDKNKINQIYTSSKKVLKNISLIMLIIGFIISFALKLFTKNTLSLIYMQIVFMLYLFRSIMEYLMFAPRFVLTADQKAYKINLGINIYKIAEILIEIAILQIYQNYAIILISSIIIRFFSYYTANKITFKQYPWLQTVNSNIKISGMGNVLYHKISGTVFSNTDILIISTFLSPLEVTIYSSYNYIIKFINDIVYMFASSITASMGNVIYKENMNKQIDIFEKINSIFIFMAMTFSIILYWSINSFVSLWIGADKIISKSALILMIFTLFIIVSARPFLLIRDAKALYKETKFIAISEALINIILSLILIRFFGITGVVFATAFATLFTTNIFYPIFVYKKVFNITYIKYFIKLILSIILTITICYLSHYINILNSVNNYLIWFFYSAIYAFFIIVLIFIINYIFSKYFKSISNEFLKKIFFKLRGTNEKNNF